MKASGIRSLARTTVVSMERIPAMRTSWLECDVLPSRMSPIALFIIADQAMQRPVPVVLDVVCGRAFAAASGYFCLNSWNH